MRIWNGPKLVLFHAPKTAGTSVYFFLDGFFGKSNPVLGDPHTTVSEGKHLIPEGYNVFTIMRHPYTRAISHYLWFKQTSKSKRFEFKKYAATLDFEDWVLQRYDIDTTSQDAYHLENATIIKQENLVGDLDNFFNKKLSLDLDLTGLPHMYGTGSENGFRDSLREDVEKVIYEKEKWVFDNEFYKRSF